MALLRLGILSTARISERCILQVLPDISDVLLLAVASRTEAKAREYSKKHGIPKFYGSYQDLLLDPEIDAVYVPLPNSLHIEWTSQALAYGKHVLCEKPMSCDTAQVLAIEALARKKNLYVMEAMHYRYHPDILKAVSIIRSGYIGDIREVNVSFVWDLHDRNDIRLRPDFDGGALMDIGCYCLDFIRWVTGDNQPRLVEANAIWCNSGVDVTTWGTLLCHDKIVAKFYCSLNSIAFECKAEILGTQRSLELKFPFLPVVKSADTVSHLFSCHIHEADREMQWQYCMKSSYFFQLQEFHDAIQRGCSSPLIGQNSYYNAALIAQVASAIHERVVL